MTKFKHAGLTVSKDDIQNFYMDILGFRTEGEFQLNNELAESIFNIDENIDVQYLIKGEVILELFILSEFSLNPSFNHICLIMDNCNLIYEKARKKNYWTFHKTNSKNQSTYFIKDNMNNLFELKNN